MQLTQVEYLERLVNLMPPDTFIANQQLSFGKDCILSSCTMVEALADEILKQLGHFQETDVVLDLKDATINLAVLGTFLGRAYYSIFEEGKNEKLSF